MSNKLWEQYAGWKENCKFVELSHIMSPETPHWSGFPAEKVSTMFDYPDGFFVHEFTLVSQYGTHVDAPCHFVQGTRKLHEIDAKELVMPLCVIDITSKIVGNDDYGCSADDIKEWEAANGPVPEGAFVALRTDWSKRDDLNNYDAEGNKHYPAWHLDALKYLVEERNIGAIGHETSDTDTAVLAATVGYDCETYILSQNRYQIELLKNLDQVPATGSLIFCGFPRAKDAPGFSARCIAVCPKD